MSKHDLMMAIAAAKAEVVEKICKCCPLIWIAIGDGVAIQIQDRSWTPPIHDVVPHALGCPKHRPVKQYCRIHHAGFYGDCLQCQLSEPRPAVDLDGSPAVSTEAPGEDVDLEILKLEAQREILEAAIDELS